MTLTGVKFTFHFGGRTPPRVVQKSFTLKVRKLESRLFIDQTCLAISFYAIDIASALSHSNKRQTSVEMENACDCPFGKGMTWECCAQVEIAIESSFFHELRVDVTAFLQSIRYRQQFAVR